jgi:pimeloyl-ACP methyl ester carboxylesterase
LTWIWVVLGIVVLYLAIGIGAALVSRRPFRIPFFVSPGILGFPQESVAIDLDDMQLRGWWTEHPETEAVVILLHGYMMNRCEFAPLVPPLFEQGCSVLMMDFRAHGSSGGKECTFGLKETEDVEQMIAWVRKRSPDVPIILYGSSMGGAAAVYAAERSPEAVHGLVLDGAYRNLLEAGRGWWVMVGGRWLELLLRPSVHFGLWMLRVKPSQVSVEEHLTRVQHLPTLLLYGDADPLVPPDSAKAILKAAGEDTQLVWFEGGGHGHGRFREPLRYRQVIVDFVKGLTSSDSADDDGS